MGRPVFDNVETLLLFAFVLFVLLSIEFEFHPCSSFLLARSNISAIVPYNVCCGGKMANKDVKPTNNVSGSGASAAAAVGGDLSLAVAALDVAGHEGGASATSASMGN